MISDGLSTNQKTTLDQLYVELLFIYLRKSSRGKNTIKRSMYGLSVLLAMKWLPEKILLGLEDRNNYLK